MIPGENIEKLQKKCTCKLLILIIVIYIKFNNTISIKNGSSNPIVDMVPTDGGQPQQILHKVPVPVCNLILSLNFQIRIEKNKWIRIYKKIGIQSPELIINA